MKLPKLNLKNFNIYTILSILFLLGGILHWIYWGSRYGVWTDIGIYSITIVLVLPGIIGLIISLMQTEETD
jgi:hypothetical protein